MQRINQTDMMIIIEGACQMSQKDKKIDETEKTVQDGIDILNTYSLMPGTKVVSFVDSKVFYSKKNEVRTKRILFEDRKVHFYKPNQYKM